MSISKGYRIPNKPQPPKNPDLIDTDKQMDNDVLHITIDRNRSGQPLSQEVKDMLSQIRPNDGPMFHWIESFDGKPLGYDKVKPGEDGVLVPAEDHQMTFDEVCEMEYHNGMVQRNS